MKVITIVGARPQFIKAAVVSKALREAGVDEVMVHTGQHYDREMSELFFEQLKISAPKYNLGIGGCGHGAMTGQMLEQLETVFLKEQPDWVVVYGDTNSTLAGALAAVKLHVPVAHVEAGLRSFNRKMPEEMNRILTDQCSDLLLTPTETGRDNLLREGFKADSIHVTGDVMYDASLLYCGDDSVLLQYGLTKGQYSLVTVHRAENTDCDERLREIFRGLSLLAERSTVVLPLHPRTRARLEQLGMMQDVERSLSLLPPIGYQEMLSLEAGANVIITDSGGVQKEAYFCGVPCIIMRDQTEWTELVERGGHVLFSVGRDDWMDALTAAGSRETEHSLYGDGNAGVRIVELLARQ